MGMESEELLVNLSETISTKYYGKYRGIVVDSNDPEKMGRITAQVPEVLQDQITPWALPAVPFAGPGHGLVLIPEPGDGVWIEFEAGDPSRPIWTGCWWAPGELPDPGDILTRALVTTKGHKFVLDDLKNEIQLLHSDGAEMKMTSDDIKLKIGDAEFTMTKDQISLKVTTTEITMTATELTLKGGPTAQLKLSSAGVDINNGAMKII